MTARIKPLDRRSFLKASAAALGASAIGFPDIIPARALAAQGRPGANDRITVGHIGIGGQGGNHLNYMIAQMERQVVNVAAVCDVDEQRLASSARKAGPQATPYRDYRYLIERKDIDAVVIGTPDHWHALQTVHAAECGKHVYVEKPACCTIEEGKRMIEAAQRNKVAVQVGSQGRSQREAYYAHRYIANGMLGKVHTVTCWHYASPEDRNPLPDGNPPPELDWDLWLGPLAWRPYNRRYCHGTFRWLMESGGGQIRDRGAHVMSNALFYLNADHQPPVSVEAKGTVPKKGLWDAAIDMEVEYVFKNPDWKMYWRQPGNMIPYFDEQRKKGLGIRDTYGAVYHGDKDKLIVWVGDGQLFTETKALEWQLSSGGKDVERSQDHHLNWFEGIRTGKRTIMNIEAGVAVANLCVLGNLSLILGRKLMWDGKKQEIIGDEEARRLMSRPQRYPYVL